MSKVNILIYLVRRDLRMSDNPILHHLVENREHHGFTHLLPVYVFPAQQMEVSGFLRDGHKSPYPEAKSQVGQYWRCGPHRAKFIGEAVWDMKRSLESIGSGLLLRAGMFGDVTKELLQSLADRQQKVGAVWMTVDDGFEEKQDEHAVSAACKDAGVDFKPWVDEKYFVDDRDVGLKTEQDLPDVYTNYRKMKEPLRDRPRDVLPTPKDTSLPPFPEASSMPEEPVPFSIPTTMDALREALLKPISNFLPNAPEFPDGVISAHPFEGGETAARTRLDHLVLSGVMADYKNSRNGLLGTEYSTKLSAYLAQGCITARQIHHTMVQYEDGKEEAFKDAPGFGEGENEGTKAVRFELLWRDYMRLCTKKFKQRLFRLEGFGGEATYKHPKQSGSPNGNASSQSNDNAASGNTSGNSSGKENGERKPKVWKTANKDTASPKQSPSPDVIAGIIDRFNRGTTGMGLIDASQRELLHTGYTSNRARQNTASFLSKHLNIDWRYGAEWYEMLLVDYDVSSNWANWQYMAGVGNDPRGDNRIFNPVKQAFDYDKDGDYVRAWVPEVRELERLENVFQPWTTSAEDLAKAGLEGNQMVTDPITRIEFSVDSKPRSRRPFRRRGGRGGPGHGVNNGVGGHMSMHYGGNPMPYGYYDGSVYRGGGGGGGGYRGRGGGFGGTPRGFYNAGFQGGPGGMAGGFGFRGGYMPQRFRPPPHFPMQSPYGQPGF